MDSGSQQPRRWVGQPVLRREDARLLQGRGSYVDDIHLPNMLHVGLVRSPLAHGAIDACVTERARRMSGVVGIFTVEDMLPTVNAFPNRLPLLRPVYYYPLATERVRFVGDPVAAVVADSSERVEDAVNEVELHLTPLPTVASPDDALRADAQTLYAEWPDNVSVHRSASFGDVDAAFASADVVVDETFYMGRQSALPLEPRGCVATFDGIELTVWSSTQCPHILRSTLAELLSIPEPRIRVIAPDVGGGFGLKYQIYREEVLVAWLARALRRPVKWREERREQLAAATHSRDKRVRLELAARADGTILGLRASMVVDVGTAMAYPYSYGSTLVLAGGMPLGLRVQNYAYDYRCVVTNKSASGAYRGFGNNMRVFVVDRTLDLLAKRLNMDRAEIRRKNLVSRADLPYRSATGTRISTGTVTEALDKAFELVHYSELPARQVPARKEGAVARDRHDCLRRDRCTELLRHGRRLGRRRFGHDQHRVRRQRYGAGRPVASGTGARNDRRPGRRRRVGPPSRPGHGPGQRYGGGNTLRAGRMGQSECGCRRRVRHTRVRQASRQDHADRGTCGSRDT